MAAEFGGRIGTDWRDSQPWWPPEPAPPPGIAERAARRARRRRLRPARLLRLRHRDAGDRRPGGHGRPAGELPHHRAVLADPGLPADRPQPPPQRHGPGGRPGHRLSRLLGQAAAGERLPVARSCAAPATPATPSASGTCPPRTRRTWPRPARPGRWLADSTAGTASTAARRTSSFPPSTTTTTASARPRSQRGRLPPHRGPGRPGDRVPRRPARGRRGASRSFCTSRPAPATPRTSRRGRWLERYRGRFDLGWDAWREQIFARQLAAGLLPAVDRAVAAAALGAGLGLASATVTRRSRLASWSASPASCPTPTSRSAAYSTSCGNEVSSTTRSSAWSPTTGPAPRAAPRARSTTSGWSTSTRRSPTRCSPGSTRSAAR